MVKYSSLDECVDSLLNDKFRALGSLAVSVKSKTKDGVKLNFYAKKKNGSEDFTGGLKFSEAFKKDKLNLSLDADIKEDGTYNEKAELSGLVEGLKVKADLTLLQTVETDKAPLKGDAEKKKVRNTGSVTLAYSNADFKTDANLTVTKKQLNDANVSLDLGAQVHDNVALGVKVYGTPFKKLTDEEKKKYRKVVDTDFKLKLFTEDVSIVAALEKAGKNTSLSVVHALNENLTVGAQWTRDLGLNLPWCYKGEKSEEKDGDKKEGEKKEEGKKWGLTGGFSYKSDHKTVVSGRLNDKGDLAGAYEFDLKDNLRTTLALETNVKELGKNAKLGVSFTFSQ